MTQIYIDVYTYTHTHTDAQTHIHIHTPQKPQEAEKGEKHITIMKNPTLKRTHNGDKVNKKSCC